MSGGGTPPCVWLDGRLRPAAEPALRADDGAYQTGLGCYTTGRVQAGRVRHGTRVAERLVRDARRLGLPAVEATLVERGMCELAEACFGDGPGIVRMQASADAAGRLSLLGVARAVGPEPPSWRLRSAPFAWPAPGPLAGVKLSGQPLLAWARRWLREQGDAEEALLFDAEGRLVEGTRATPVLRLADGAWVTPPLARGGVAGVARAILLERLPELREADVGRDAVRGAAEIAMVNAVRGACPVSRLDGAHGPGSPGPLCARLSQALEAEA